MVYRQYCKYLRQCFFLGLCLFPLTACGIPSGVLVASYAVDSVLMMKEGKSSTDYALSLLANRDCVMWRLIQGDMPCQENTLREGKLPNAGKKDQSPEDQEVFSVQSPLPVENFSFPPPHIRVPREHKMKESEQSVLPTKLATVSDPSIQQVSSDPSIQRVSSDPSIQQVSSDPSIQQVSSDPSIQRVSSDPSIQQASYDLPPDPPQGKDFGLGQRIQEQPAFDAWKQDVYLCIGSFREARRAKTLQRRFYGQGARIIEVMLEGKRWYRVLLPPSFGESTQAFSVRFSQETGILGWLVPYQSDSFPGYGDGRI